jgi:UDP-N-acetylglucosamine:LPS N-acetylglucosamine transferase
MEGKKKILFLYLDSGGGHKAPAMAVANWINEHEGHRAKAVVANGISSKNVLTETIIEQGYRIVTTRFPTIWKSFYDMSQPRLSLFVNSVIIVFNALFHLAGLLWREKPDMVVNCHFLLNYPLKILRRATRGRFKVITLCTDPFTIHPFWLYKQYGTLLVFSKVAREEIMAFYRVPPYRLPLFSWVLQERYSSVLTRDRVLELKKEFGLDPDKRLVLIAGGGEGLPGTEKYFTALLDSWAEFDIVVACGKNESIRRHCEEILKKKAPKRTVKVIGFTKLMYEYVNCAELVISKAGTSTVMETLSQGKPLIIAQYLYGQEFGNAVFVVRKGLGLYAPKPSEMRSSVERLLSDPKAYRRITERIVKAEIKNGTPDVVAYILKKIGA